eukprot:a174980_79.p1 GENE.a174980_79~~a174980_79.p1  ORF type:complete len:337 (+),score=90.80 a174980_79:53-1012(+)
MAEHNEPAAAAPVSPAEGDASFVMLLGAGPSSAVPLLYCLFPESSCEVCKSAVAGPPEQSRNYRTNPSLLIRWDSDGKGTLKTVLIDCGKTFREQAVRWFPKLGVRTIDTLILTHEHMDALGGLDDIRSMQGKDPPPVRICCDAKTYATCRRVFPYLTGDIEIKEGVVRHVAALQFEVIGTTDPFNAAGLAVQPLEVMHGEDYVALGFEFGASDRVVYISDVSRVPDATMARLLAGQQIALLYVDCLFKERTHATHFNYSAALEFIRALRPKSAVLMGLTHDFDYEATSEELRGLVATGSLPCPVEMAYDGIRHKVSLR